MLWPEEWYEWSVCSASCDGGTKRATLRLPSVYNHRRNNHWMNWANQRLTWLDDIVIVHCSCSCILIKPPCLFEAENAMLPLPLKTGEGRKSLICFDKLACFLGSHCKCVSTVYLLFVTAFAWPLTKARSRQELFSSWWAAYFQDFSVRVIIYCPVHALRTVPRPCNTLSCEEACLNGTGLRACEIQNASFAQQLKTLRCRHQGYSYCIVITAVLPAFW